MDIRTCEVIEGNLSRRQQEGKMYPAVKSVVPNEDFTLSIVFDNGEEGILDM